MSNWQKSGNRPSRPCLHPCTTSAIAWIKGNCTRVGVWGGEVRQGGGVGVEGAVGVVRGGDAILV